GGPGGVPGGRCLVRFPLRAPPRPFLRDLHHRGLLRRADRGERRAARPPPDHHPCARLHPRLLPGLHRAGRDRHRGGSVPAPAPRFPPARRRRDDHLFGVYLTGIISIPALSPEREKPLTTKPLGLLGPVLV